MRDKQQNDDYSPLENLILTETFDMESLQRHSEAALQHLDAFGDLSKVADSHINPDYWKQNLKQQAGYSAEIKYTAKNNADAIIEGRSVRYTRTDDLPGHVNDPLYDHVQLDAQGKPLWETGEQMKFIGKNGDEWFRKMSSNPKFQKYFDIDETLTCPSDYYDGILKAADKEIDKLQGQIDHLRAEGKYDLADAKQIRQDKVIQLKTNLKDSGISSYESMLARISPSTSTAIDLALIGHHAGMEQLKSGTWAIVASGMSICKNAVAYFNDEKTFEQALLSMGKDVVGSGVSTYFMSFGSSTTAALLSNSSNTMLQSIGSSWGPVFMALTAWEACKSLNKLRKGEITPEECFAEIMDKSLTIAGAQLGAAVGQAMIPIPVIGAMIGSVLGTVISTYVIGGCKALYHDIKSIDAQVKQAHERSLAIQVQCAEAIRQVRHQRMQMQVIAAQYMSGFMQTFNLAFDEMKEAIISDNIDLFIHSNNLIIEKCGGQVQFRSFREFDDFMLEGKTFKL